MEPNDAMRADGMVAARQAPAPALVEDEVVAVAQLEGVNTVSAPQKRIQRQKRRTMTMTTTMT